MCTQTQSNINFYVNSYVEKKCTQLNSRIYTDWKFERHKISYFYAQSLSFQLYRSAPLFFALFLFPLSTKCTILKHILERKSRKGVDDNSTQIIFIADRQECDVFGPIDNQSPIENTILPRGG